MRKYRVTRDVTKQECWWLSKPVLKDTVVYEYYGPTYGVIGNGIPVSAEMNQIPFFELPWNAVTEVIETPGRKC